MQNIQIYLLLLLKISFIIFQSLDALKNEIFFIWSFFAFKNNPHMIKYFK